jgi:hypothetical protein
MSIEEMIKSSQHCYTIIPLEPCALNAEISFADTTKRGVRG